MNTENENESTEILDRIQNQLENLYGIDVSQRVQDFLIEKHQALGHLDEVAGDIPRELFFVRQPENGIVEVALFLDGSLLRNLKNNNPFDTINEKNLSDFCTVIEGISHFVYYLWKAQKNHSVTQLELELQAEIDKFFMLYFYLQTNDQEDYSDQIFECLFDNFRLFDGLNDEKMERYRMASSLAARYCHAMKTRYRKTAEINSLIRELRHFYQMTQAEKIRLIPQ